MPPMLSLLRHSTIVAVLAMVLGAACANAVAAASDQPAAAPAPQQPAPLGAQKEEPEADVSETNRSLEIIRDCNDDGVLQGRDSYSAADLERARRELASDVDQYSDCRAVISAALNKKSKGAVGTGPAGGIPVTAEQRARFETVLAKQIEQSRSGAKPTIPIDGHTITPGSGSTFTSTARPGTPLSLFLIAGLFLLAAIPGIYGGARVVMARRGWHLRPRSPGGAGSLRLPGRQAGSGE